MASQMALVVKNLPTNSGDIRDEGSIPGLGRSPGEGNGNPLQYSCLENPMDRGTWRATVHRVSQSQTRLKQLGMHTHTLIIIAPDKKSVAFQARMRSLNCFKSQFCSKSSPKMSKVKWQLVEKYFPSFLLVCWGSSDFLKPTLCVWFKENPFLLSENSECRFRSQSNSVACQSKDRFSGTMDNLRKQWTK